MAKPRLGATLACAVALGAIGAPAVARADAPDPAPAATTSAVVTNADGSRTVWASGAWAWSTHRGDCNRDGRAVGYAVDWDDPDLAGNFVTTYNNAPVDVGSGASNPFNPFDNLVHATTPATPANDTPDVATWRGGCGTYNPSLGYNTGTWGPIVHTYAPDFQGDVQICVVMYDVHLSANGQAKQSREIQAGDDDDAPARKGGPKGGHNPDNSAEANKKTPLGNGCFKTAITTPAGDPGGGEVLGNG
jgi:hypothetical protein